MSIYDIDEAIERLVDPETGELLDYEAFLSLQMERETKIDNIACWCINLKAEAEALRKRELELAARRYTVEHHLDGLKDLLKTALDGQKFKSDRVSVSYHTSKGVTLDEKKFFDWAKFHPEFLRIKDPEPDKKAISEALKAGEKIPGAVLEQRKSVIIK